MKTFYVEDDCNRILANLGIVPNARKDTDRNSLFGALLDSSDRKKLDKIISDAAKDELPVDEKDISELFNSSHPRLTIMIDFKSALKCICGMDRDERAKYDLFVFDRNLCYGTRYTLAEIQEIDGKFTRQDYDHCRQDTRDACREGDYLLRRIFYLLREDGVSADEIRQRIYILSAYPQKEISDRTGSGGGPLRDLYEQKYLTRRNYIDKDDEKRREELRQIVGRNEKILKIRRKYQRAFDFFGAFDNGIDDVNTILGYLVNLNVETAPREIEKRIWEIQKIYKRPQYQMFKEIEARLDEIKADQDAERKRFPDRLGEINSAKWRSRWYADHKGIPQNIVDMGRFVKNCRNGEEHYNDYGSDDNSNLDLTAFTLWAQIMALLEVARYFLEKDQ